MITVRNLVKIFQEGEVVTHVLKGVDLTIQTGEFVAIMGRSGAGKSTLLYQVSLLDHPSSGAVTIDEVEVTALSTTERTQYRLNNLGYVFQDYALIPELTAKENVALPLLMQGFSKEKAYKKALEVLASIGLADRANNLPSKLSGGQQQRVSIARAVAHDPKILFADEPTANLDSESGQMVMNLFQELHKKGQTIVMVTHEEEYGKLADRIVRLSDGQVVK
ncbi:MAG: ABC transporter ATP-binding protein [Minisyncoccia bacterium]